MQALRDSVLDRLHKFKPVELCMVLTAYGETELLDEQLQVALQMQYREKHEQMNPLDSATFYYYFTKQGFSGEGLFYKNLQKSVSRTIG